MKFRKDDGTIISIDFDVAMERMGCGGFLTLDDGEVVRRVYDEPKVKLTAAEKGAPTQEIVSDAAGFIAKQLPEMIAHRDACGFKGKVDFREDPNVPGFIQTVFTCSDEDRQKYFDHRNIPGEDAVSGSGAMLPPDFLEQAEKLAKRKGFGDGHVKEESWRKYYEAALRD